MSFGFSWTGPLARTLGGLDPFGMRERDRVDPPVWALTSLSGPEPPPFTFAGEKNYTRSRINLNEQSVDAMLRAAMEQGREIKI